MTKSDTKVTSKVAFESNIKETKGFIKRYVIRDIKSYIKSDIKRYIVDIKSDITSTSRFNLLLRRMEHVITHQSPPSHPAPAPAAPSHPAPAPPAPGAPHRPPGNNPQGKL